VPYILDEASFDAVLAGQLNSASFAGAELVATEVQMLALRRKEAGPELKTIFKSAEPVRISEVCFDEDGFGWTEEVTGPSYEALLQRLNAKLGDSNDCGNDLIIAEIALRNKATFVTNNPVLRDIVQEFGGTAVDTKTLLRKGNLRS
jgi:hypothetical protein